MTKYIPDRGVFDHTNLLQIGVKAKAQVCVQIIPPIV